MPLVQPMKGLVTAEVAQREGSGVGGRSIRIALAGNANTGKSVIFNELTGLYQNIGNWPGKTVEKAEGMLRFKGYTIYVIDLPGIYSLSTFSIEEIITREYIVNERPDVVINVVDASVLERNLFLTLQLMELEAPLLIALNQIDVAERKGIRVDHKRLEEILGVPVIPTIAIKSKGIRELLSKVVEGFEGGFKKPATIRYSDGVESRIRRLEGALSGADLRYPPRWVAIKLLERDSEVIKEVKRVRPEALTLAEELAGEIEKIYGYPCPTVIASERYKIAVRIAEEAQRLLPPVKPTLSDRIDQLTTHKIYGYLVMAAVTLAMFYAIFTLGIFLSRFFTNIFYSLRQTFEVTFGLGVLSDLVWGGFMEGVRTTATIIIPFLIPFYLLLSILEDSGYLARMAFLMDAFMHKIGLHGKAFIPLMFGYVCTVPACLSCRIMETERDKIITGFVATLIPCISRSIIILGLVGAYLGMGWALCLYAIDLAIAFALGKIASRALPGEGMELIMEMPDYKVPHLGTIVKQTLFRLKEFLGIGFPVIVASCLIIKAMEVSGILLPISRAMSPVTVNWLGLPEVAGVLLIFGVVRKELALVLLAATLGTQNIYEAFTPIQMFTFSLVMMLYIPCVATIAALIKEFGWRKAAVITVAEIMFAVLLGGLAYRVLVALGLLGHF